MENSIRAAREFLARGQQKDGGWAYQAGGQSSPEPTCYSLLALSLTAGEPASRDPHSETRQRGLGWLRAQVNANGAVVLDGDDEPHWSTSLLIITLSRLQQAQELRDRCIKWLSTWQGMQSEPQEEVPLNSQLIGWPWTSDTFSWVEPTSYAVLAFKLSGHGDHSRVKEAERLLLDRACVGGGWNYGNRVVLGRDLAPFLPTTALALLALQDIRTDSRLIDQSLAFLRREASQNQSALTLALTVLCLNVFGQSTDEFVSALLKRQRLDGSWRRSTHLTALAVLAMASAQGGSNVFEL